MSQFNVGMADQFSPQCFDVVGWTTARAFGKTGL